MTQGKIKVAVCGCLGRMGQAVTDAVSSADDMVLVCGIDPVSSSDYPAPIFSDVQTAINESDFNVMVDFTRPDVAASNIRTALDAGIDCVVGTTGIGTDELQQLADNAKDDACLFFAPNFTIGAVLMMQFAKMAAPYFDQVEIVEQHHCNKKDAPSGTAIATAKMISDARDGKPSDAPGSETELDGCKGARGALVDGIPVHSMRSMGFVANQEVVLGSLGQILEIKHESWDRSSYMPGVLLAIRSVDDLHGLVVGLDKLMKL